MQGRSTAAARRRAAALARPFVLLGATIVLLIAGLLGMHTLVGTPDGAHSGHVGAATPVHAGHATHAEHATHLSASAAGAVPDGPARTADEPPAPAHDHSAALACVLALLAGLIVLVRPESRASSWQRLLPRAGAVPPVAPRASAPPPDLASLSISRT